MSIRHRYAIYSNLDYQYKIFIAGNHDFYFEDYSQQEIQEKLPENMYYLNDSGICIEGINIWGSPITPTFFNWAFNKDRGYDIIQHWQKIPDNTDILITHGPPNMILDKTIYMKLMVYIEVKIQSVSYYFLVISISMNIKVRSRLIIYIPYNRVV